MRVLETSDPSAFSAEQKTSFAVAAVHSCELAPGKALVFELPELAVACTPGAC